ncbi:hypothetical protein GZH47_06760 [Paenibacillus rhizovicinus]|uniref:Anti-sigma-W factor RsiW n=2 Tax=Paenibacillus rhizovicinus TaxID=2704463 RepID=A0A6C0NWS1_9BACL|nr:hypothetical protein GZH47_06760 [Paenibacillus rhizovicinus]
MYVQPESNPGSAVNSNVSCNDSAAYIYDGLSEDSRAAFEAHLEQCSECRRFIADVHMFLSDFSPSDANVKLRPDWIVRGLITVILLLVLATTIVILRMT